MRVLVYPHDLNMGGSQTNALEIAARIRDLGVESIIFGRPGVLNTRMDDLGLEFIESPNPGRRPSIKIAQILRSIARERRVDVLHGYEWPPALECSAAAYGLPSTVSVSTVMSMGVAPFIPKTMPLVVGTEQIAQAERTAGRRNVTVIEPPVDLQHNLAPGAPELAAFRERWGLRRDASLIVCVSRLANELKLEGILSAIDAIGTQLSDLNLQFLIVGGGPAADQVRFAAERANSATEDDRVILTGELLDPRAAYAAADIVVGMGGSALRALAFGKPLIVQGEHGFFAPLTPQSWPTFAFQGWYGSGFDDGPDIFASTVRDMVSNTCRLAELSEYGRSLVNSRFSLDSAAQKQLSVYTAALEDNTRSHHHAVAASVSGIKFTTHVFRRKVRTLLGRGTAVDDFNARPLVRPSTREQHVRDRDSVLYLSGEQWDSVEGTNIQLARELGQLGSVIWVDPSSSILRRWEGDKTPVVSSVAPGVVRLHPSGPPGITRFGVRRVARWSARRLVRQHLAESGRRITVVFGSSAQPVLGDWRALSVPRVYFATDDFVAGAELMGLSPTELLRARTVNLDAAHLALAVTPNLADILRSSGVRVQVFPNGCDTARYERVPVLDPAPEITVPGPRAGVVGQLNPRLDLACLEAVADTGTSLLLVGPLIDRDPAFAVRFRALAERENVEWLPRQPSERLPEMLAGMSVGLTPYADSAFNRSSFPLKTLDYLAAGLPVVSTDLPASRDLDSRFVKLSSTPAGFAAEVLRCLDRDWNPSPDEIQSYARQFSWTQRALELRRTLDDLERPPGEEWGSSATG